MGRALGARVIEKQPAAWTRAGKQHRRTAPLAVRFPEPRGEIERLRGVLWVRLTRRSEVP